MSTKVTSEKPTIADTWMWMCLHELPWNINVHPCTVSKHQGMLLGSEGVTSTGGTGLIWDTGLGGGWTGVENVLTPRNLSRRQSAHLPR